jgi:hypothetical protein
MVFSLMEVAASSRVSVYVLKDLLFFYSPVGWDGLEGSPEAILCTHVCSHLEGCPLIIRKVIVLLLLMYILM